MTSNTAPFVFQQEIILHNVDTVTVLNESSGMTASDGSNFPEKRQFASLNPIMMEV